MPVLELDDGTLLSQSWAILKFIGHKNGLIPTDPMQIYKGDCVHQLFCMDYKEKDMSILWSAPNEKAQ